jgi:phage terminase large subunit GpA-like protein
VRWRIHLFTVGVDPAKGLIYSRLKLTENGPGYWHFPATENFDEEFYAQLKAPSRVRDLTSGELKYRWTMLS